VEKPAQEGLVRGISRWDLVAIAINGIIGAGIFGLPSKVYALIGTYSLIAFVACALVVALIILCFAEVGSRFKETGGPYLYAREAFGPTVAFEIGFLIWLARITAFAANCNLLVSYTSYFWPQATNSLWRPTIIVLVVAVLTVINLRGVKQAAMVSNVSTIGKLIPIIIFIAAGLYFINPQSYSFGAAPTTGAFSQSVLLLIYAFTGFEMATIPAGEIRDPKKDLPIALLTALCVVAVLYILIQVVCVGTLMVRIAARRSAPDEGAVDEELIAPVDGDGQLRRIRRSRERDGATEEKPPIAPVVAALHAGEELVPVAERVDRLASGPDERSASVH
jgi:amino acid transporter